MASLSGWIFVVIGGIVALWSVFQSSLIFFAIIGAVMILYGISKILYARAFNKKNDLHRKTQIGTHMHTHGQTDAQSQFFMQQQRSRMPAQQQQNVMHHQQQHSQSLSAQAARPHQHSPMQPNAQQHSQQPTHANMHQPQTAYKVCPNCKKHMHVTYRFCPHCGWGV